MLLLEILLPLLLSVKVLLNQPILLENVLFSQVKVGVLCIELIHLGLEASDFGLRTHEDFSLSLDVGLLLSDQIFFLTMLFPESVHFGVQASQFDTSLKDSILLLLVLGQNVLILDLLPLSVDVTCVSIMDNAIKLAF